MIFFILVGIYLVKCTVLHQSLSCENTSFINFASYLAGGILEVVFEIKGILLVMTKKDDGEERKD